MTLKTHRQLSLRLDRLEAALVLIRQALAKRRESSGKQEAHDAAQRWVGNGK